MKIEIKLNSKEIESILIKHIQAMFPQHIVNCGNEYSIDDIEFTLTEPEKQIQSGTTE